MIRPNCRVLAEALACLVTDAPRRARHLTGAATGAITAAAHETTIDLAGAGGAITDRCVWIDNLGVRGLDRWPNIGAHLEGLADGATLHVLTSAPAQGPGVAYELLRTLRQRLRDPASDRRTRASAHAHEPPDPDRRRRRRGTGDPRRRDQRRGRARNAHREERARATPRHRPGAVGAGDNPRDREHRGRHQAAARARDRRGHAHPRASHRNNNRGTTDSRHRPIWTRAHSASRWRSTAPTHASAQRVRPSAGAGASPGTPIGAGAGTATRRVIRENHPGPRGAQARTAARPAPVHAGARRDRRARARQPHTRRGAECALERVARGHADPWRNVLEPSARRTGATRNRADRGGGVRRQHRPRNERNAMTDAASGAHEPQASHPPPRTAAAPPPQRMMPLAPADSTRTPEGSRTHRGLNTRSGTLAHSGRKTGRTDDQ